MSLQIWLPLKGDFKNYGLIPDDQIIQTNAPTFEKKAHYCMTAGGVKMTAKAASSVLNNQALTIAFWIYPNVDEDGTGGIIFGTNSMVAPNNRKFAIFQYPNANDIHWSWQNDENTTFTSGARSNILPSYTWTHVCFTYDGSTVRLYINGILTNTSTGISASETFAYDTQLIHNNTNRWISDFRIYDNCLSLREVQLLAAGLVLHYPLNDPCPTLAANKYSGETYKGKCSYSGFTMTKLIDEIGYNYTFSYTGTGSNKWTAIEFPVATFTAGKKYLFSCKIRNHGSTHTLYFRPARCQNDYNTTQINVTNVNDGKWHEYSGVVELAEKVTVGGTEKDTAPRVEFYTINTNTSGTVYKYDFDIKDVMIAELATIGLKAQDGSWSDGKIYDCSGYQNNAQVVTSSPPELSLDTPRYDACYYFNGSNQIQKIPNPLIDVPFSISFWLNLTQNKTATIYTARSSVGKGIAIFIINQKFRFDAMGCQSSFTYTIPLNTWIQFTMTCSKTEKKLYVNGELAQTVAISTSMEDIGQNGTIGASESSDNGVGTDNWLVGRLSDFRLYVSELSADLIKTLYQTSGSLVDTSSLLLSGEVYE